MIRLTREGPYTLKDTNAGYGIYTEAGKEMCYEWDISKEDAEFILRCLNLLARKGSGYIYE